MRGGASTRGECWYTEPLLARMRESRKLARSIRKLGSARRLVERARGLRCQPCFEVGWRAVWPGAANREFANRG
jgi:hypothetical protein